MAMHAIRLCFYAFFCRGTHMETSAHSFIESDLTMRDISASDSPKTPLTEAARQATQRHSRSPAVHSIAWQPPPVHHTVPLQSPRRQRSADSRSYAEVCNEHQYLIASLQRQDERIRALLGTLCSVQTEQQLPQNSADARRLRKDAGFMRSKIAEAEQQERLILGRLIDVWSEVQRRNRLSHLWYLQQQQQQQQMAREQAHIDLGAPLQLWIPTFLPVKHTAGSAPPSATLISPLAPFFRSRNVLDAERSGPGLSAAVVGVEGHNTNTGCTVYHSGKPPINVRDETDETYKMEGRTEKGQKEKKEQKEQKDEDQNASQPTSGRNECGLVDEFHTADAAPRQSCIRRCSSSMATHSLQDKQKRMSLPPLRSVWPDGSA